MPDRLAVMTSFQALEATRGQWRRDPGTVEGSLCPVCKKPIVNRDYAKASHIRRHLAAGWRPGDAPAVVAEG